jgi:hypothetical protein
MVHLVLLVALASAAARQPLPAHRARTLRYGVVP